MTGGSFGGPYEGARKSRSESVVGEPQKGLVERNLTWGGGPGSKERTKQKEVTCMVVDYPR